MSAQDEVSVVVKCLRLGAADYLVKPVRTNELLNLWTHMWRRRRRVCFYMALMLCQYAFSFLFLKVKDMHAFSAPTPHTHTHTPSFLLYRDGNGAGLDPPPPPPPRYPCPIPHTRPTSSRGDFLPLIPAQQGTHGYPSHPDINSLLLLLLLLFFQKISMTTINLPTSIYMKQ